MVLLSPLRLRGRQVHFWSERHRRGLGMILKTSPGWPERHGPEARCPPVSHSNLDPSYQPICLPTPQGKPNQCTTGAPWSGGDKGRTLAVSLPVTLAPCAGNGHGCCSHFSQYLLIINYPSIP